jgi:hypothetical protein
VDSPAANKYRTKKAGRRLASCLFCRIFRARVEYGQSGERSRGFLRGAKNFIIIFHEMSFFSFLIRIDK